MQPRTLSWYRGIFLILAGLSVVACGDSPSKAAFSESQKGLSGGKVDICAVLRSTLPPAMPPLVLPPSRSLDPFTVEVQEWLKKRLQPTGVYAPVARWVPSGGKELWFIERIASEGAYYYAILADSLCEIGDTAVWAYQLIQPDRLEQAKAQIDRTGRCSIAQEEHVTEFSGEQPRTTITRRTATYEVDWASGKLRSL
ncbi:MAG: hypothetical protein N2170_07560 [Bacteroidia bacterium]|nr:hypothetical protein [Bacteroidia bacterium]